jgi:hypothetical protein
MIRSRTTCKLGVATATATNDDDFAYGLQFHLEVDRALIRVWLGEESAARAQEIERLTDLHLERSQTQATLLFQGFIRRLGARRVFQLSGATDSQAVGGAVGGHDRRSSERSDDRPKCCTVRFSRRSGWSCRRTFRGYHARRRNGVGGKQLRTKMLRTLR